MSGSMRIAAAELRSAGGALVLLTVLVGLAGGLVAAVPLEIGRAASLELRQTVNGVPEEQRNPSGVLSDPGVLAIDSLVTGGSSSIEAVYGPLRQALDRHRLAQPEPLRSSLGDAGVVVVGEPTVVLPDAPRDDDPRFQLRAVVDPDAERRVRVIDGRLPEQWSLATAAEPTVTAVDGAPSGPVPPPIEIALTAQGAEALRWTVGEVRADAAAPMRYLLTGIVEPIEGDSAYWRGIPAAPDAERFDDGNQQPRETAAAFLHPLSIVAPFARGPVAVQYPLDTGGLDAATIDTVLPQLRSFVANPLRIPYEGRLGSGSTELTLVSALPAAADAVLKRVGVTQAVLAFTIAGSLGALGVVLVLSARAAVDRRRPVLALRLARGASRGRLSLELVAGALLLTVPAALAGFALGAVGGAMLGAAPPGAVIAALVGPASVATLAGVALAPAAVLAALVPRARDVRERRGDLQRPGASRRVVELAVLALAAVSVWFVLQRGIVASAGAVGIDPLLVAMPLLVALASGVLVGRGYPFVLGLVQRVGAERRGAVPTIGVRRASRDHATGPVVVLVTVLVTAVAVSSVALLAAVDVGLDRAARDELGAAVRATGPGATAEFAAAAAALPEVGAIGSIDTIGPAVLTLDRVRENATVISIDAGAAALRDDLPVGFGETATPVDEPVPVLMSADLLPELDARDELPPTDADISVGGVDVLVVGLGRVAAGYGTAGSWVVVAAADAGRFSSTPIAAPVSIDAVLVDPAPGVAPSVLVEALTAVAASFDPPARAELRLAVAADLAAADRAAPLTVALRTALLTGAVLAVLLGVAALAVAAVVGRPRRRQVQALARVLGAPRARSLVAWELGPPAALGVAAGSLVGVVLAVLAVAAADLRSVTGQADQVVPVLDPLLLSAAAGLVGLALLAVIGIATMIDRAPPLLDALRTETS